MAIRLRSYGIYFQNKGAVFEPPLSSNDFRLRVKTVIPKRTPWEAQRRAPHSHLRQVIYEPVVPETPRTWKMSYWDRAEHHRGMQSKVDDYGFEYLNRGEMLIPYGERAEAAPVETTISVTLAGRTRVEAQRRAPYYFLRPPAVLDTRPAIQTQIYVLTQAVMRRVEVRKTKSVLSPPAIVAPAAQAYYGPKTPLARIRPRKTRSFLRPPTVLQVFSGADVSLTRTRPRKTRWFLRQPTVLQVFSGPQTHLVAVSSRVDRSRRERHLCWEVEPSDTTRKLQTVYGPLAGFEGVFNSTHRYAQSFHALGTNLAALQLGLLKNNSPVDNLVVEIQSDSAGQPSGVVLGAGSISAASVGVSAGVDYYSIPVNAPLTVGQRYWVVVRRSGATDATNFLYWTEFNAATDTYSGGDFYVSTDSGGTWNPVGGGFFPQDGAANFWFSVGVYPLRAPCIGVQPPMVVEERPFAPPVKTELAVQAQVASLQRRQPYSVLRPPTVITLPTAPPIKTPFVRTRPRKTDAFLRPPTVIRVPSVEQEQQTIKVSLVQTRPPRKSAILRRPTALQVFDAGEPHLTRIRPRKTRFFLRKPVVVIPADEPTLVQQTIRTWLVRIRPPKIISELRAPATLEPYSLQLLARTIRIDLARIRPRKTRFFLRVPVVVSRQVEDQIRVTLAPQARRRGRGVLRPPQALRVFEGAATYLTRIRPRRTLTELRPPAVVTPVRAYDAPQAPHSRIRPPRTHSVLRPPATLVPFIARPIQITLVQTRPPQVRNLLREPDLSRFIPPKGKVCGFDSTSTAVCYGDIVTQIECGFDSTPTRVSGSSSARSRVSGQTSSRARTVGTDQEAS